MRRVLGVVLQLGIMLLVLMLLFSGVLWCLARYWWGYGLRDFSFLDMLVLGLVRFWETGPGVYIAAACAVMGFVSALQWLTDLWKLKKKREAVGRDVEKKAAELAEAMRAKMEAEVARSNEGIAARLNEWQLGLAVENRNVKDREEKMDTYLEELRALRKTHERYDAEFSEIRQRAHQTLEVLSRDEPATGEAKRLVKKIIKLA